MSKTFAAADAAERADFEYVACLDVEEKDERREGAIDQSLRSE